MDDIKEIIEFLKVDARLDLKAYALQIILSKLNQLIILYIYTGVFLIKEIRYGW